MIGLVVSAVVSSAGPGGKNCWSLEAQANDPLCAKIGALGRFDAAKSGPTINGARTVEVLYEPEWGTNFKEQSVSLLQQSPEGWRLIWTHRSEELSSDPFTQWESRKIYRWKYSVDARVVYVSGTRTDSSKGRRSGIKRLNTEAYCYRSHLHRFVRCG